MPDSIQITVPFPPRCLWPNARGQHRYKTGERRWFKEQCQIAAIAAGLHGLETWAGAAGAPVFYCPNRNNRDRDNANASLKYAIDAIVEAGLLTNDNHMILLPPRMDYDKENPRVLISFIRLDSGDRESLNAFAQAMEDSARRMGD